MRFHIDKIILKDRWSVSGFFFLNVGWKIISTHVRVDKALVFLTFDYNYKGAASFKKSFFTFSI